MTTSDWCIYCLVDPRTNEVRYIGKTKHIKIRLGEHIFNAKHAKRRTHVQQWIMSILESGFIPAVRILEAGSGSGWPDAERRWIANFRSSGARLVNGTDGGEGITLTAEQLKSRAKTRFNNSTAEQRSAAAKKAAATRNSKLTKEQRRERIRPARQVMDSMTKEERSAYSRQWSDKLTAQQRSEIARDREAKKTPQQRIDSAINRMAKMTAQQRSESAMRARAGIAPGAAKIRESKLTKEQRSDRAKRAQTSRTPEQRRNIALKREAGRRLVRESIKQPVASAA